MKECFIICPIGAAGSEIRKRSDVLLQYVLTPILNQMGFVPVRADKIQQSGLITTQIIQCLVDSPLVIADITGGNPNVYYELAIRHAVRLPFIQIIEKGSKIPFDISGLRTIELDHRDIASVECCKEEILGQIKSFESGHSADSPVSIAMDVRSIQENNRFAEDLLNELRLLREQNKEVVNLLTGGDSFCYLTIGSINNERRVGLLTAVHQGEHPLYDVNARIVDLQRFEEIKENLNFETIRKNEMNISIGNMIKNAASMIGPFPIGVDDERDFNIFFSSRNGFFTQLLRLRYLHGSWLSAIKVIKDKDELYVKVDDGFPRDDEGNVKW